MGRDELPDDPKFLRLSDRARHADEINGIVADWTSARTAPEVEAACVEHDVPVATAYTAADIAADPHMAARGDLVTVDDPVAGPLRQQAPFPRLAGAPVEAPTGAPHLGQHTREVLGGLLGLDDAELDRLTAADVI
jgi:formyl-CoA transferase